jgi:hypothetical protein
LQTSEHLDFLGLNSHSVMMRCCPRKEDGSGNRLVWS